MAARVRQEQPRGGVQQKKEQGERRRTALGDIGNVVTVRGGGGGVGNGPTKLQAINRPMTRSFCAQLLANAEANADKNQNVAAVRKLAAVPKKVPEKTKKAEKGIINQEKAPSVVHEKVEHKQVSRKKKPVTLTSVLTARSKEACGLARKPEELVVNIDEGSKEDELAVVEYVEDIYKFYKLAEEESRIRDYMSTQPDITKEMRSILVDWLIEVHNKFELRQETLYLTVNIIDRFLSMKAVPRKEFQLVGIASMLIACKYEEIWAPEVNDFVQISDNAYVREQVLAMEKVILGNLEWYLTVPTPYMFLTRYVKASVSADSEMEKMVYFFAELGIMNYRTAINYPPSLLAASSVYAARLTLGNTPSWTETLKHYTGYSEDQLRKCATWLVLFHTLSADSEMEKMVYVFAELGIMNYRTAINYPPSFLAASSMYAARLTLGNTPSWTETLKHYTGYSKDQLRKCATLLVLFHTLGDFGPQRLKAVFKKYSKPKAGSVALRPPAKAHFDQLCRLLGDHLQGGSTLQDMLKAELIDYSKLQAVIDQLCELLL